MKRFTLSGLFSLLIAGVCSAEAPPEDPKLLLPPAPLSGDQANDFVLLKGTTKGGGFGSIRQSSFQDPSVVAPRAEAVPGETASTIPAATCNSCSQQQCCCPSWFAFGDYLLLHPRGADPVFAVEAENCAAPPLGPAEQLDFGAESGFRVGMGKRVHGTSDLIATFAHFEADEEHSAVATPGNVLKPLLIFDASSCDDATATTASARADIDFDLVDLDYRYNMMQMLGCNNLTCNWLVGVRYGNLDQQLNAAYEQDTLLVSSDVDMHGVGLRVGGGAEYGTWIRGFGQTNLSLLASTIRARYNQNDLFLGSRVEFDRKLDRIVPVLDIQAGLAIDVTDHCVVKAGYEYHVWWNMVTTPGYISSVQELGINGGSIDDVLSFDGLFARLEIIW